MKSPNFSPTAIEEVPDVLTMPIPQVTDPDIAARIRIVLSEKPPVDSRRRLPDSASRQPFDMD